MERQPIVDSSTGAIMSTTPGWHSDQSPWASLRSNVSRRSGDAFRNKHRIGPRPVASNRETTPEMTGEPLASHLSPSSPWLVRPPLATGHCTAGTPLKRACRTTGCRQTPDSLEFKAKNSVESPVVIADGVVYIASSDKYLYAST